MHAYCNKYTEKELQKEYKYTSKNLYKQLQQRWGWCYGDRDVQTPALIMHIFVYIFISIIYFFSSTFFSFCFNGLMGDCSSSSNSSTGSNAQQQQQQQHPAAPAAAAATLPRPSTSLLSLYSFSLFLA